MIDLRGQQQLTLGISEGDDDNIEYQSLECDDGKLHKKDVDQMYTLVSETKNLCRLTSLSGLDLISSTYHQRLMPIMNPWQIKYPSPSKLDESALNELFKTFVMLASSFENWSQNLRYAQ